MRALPIAQRDALLAAFERSCNDLSDGRKRRLSDILRRHVFGGETPKALYIELGISKRYFFVDRAETLRRLGLLLEETPDSTKPQSLATAGEPSPLLLTQAQALFAAGSACSAADLLLRLDDRALSPGDRFDALRTTIDALDESRVLRNHAGEVEERIRRWGSASVEGTPEAFLARAAASWLKTRLCLPLASGRPSLGALETTRLLRRALPSTDPTVAIAYGRILAQSNVIALDRGDLRSAQTILSRLNELVGMYPHVAGALETELHMTRATVHWFDPANVHLARSERLAAYDVAIKSSNSRAVWVCLYFEIRDQFAQENREIVLALTENLFESIMAAGNPQSQYSAYGLLAEAYAFSGRFQDAIRMYEPVLQTSLPKQLLGLNLACKLAQTQRDFPAMLDLATQFVECAGGESQFPNANVAALRQQAHAAYHVGKLHVAISAIEDAVAICEANGLTEPWDLQRIYADALRITGRSRYRATLSDINSTLRSFDVRARARTMHDSLHLTKRELQTARLAATGVTNDAIARTLGIAQSTVEKHLATVFRHFAIHSRHQLASVLDEVRT